MFWSLVLRMEGCFGLPLSDAILFKPKLQKRFNSALVLNEALGNFLEHENR